MTLPQSWATTYLRSVTTPVSGSTWRRTTWTALAHVTVGTWWQAVASKSGAATPARARRGGARGDADAAGEVEPDGGALEGPDPRPFDVARDPDPLVDSALAEALLRAPELGVARGGQRRLERGTEIAAVVDERVAVAVGHPAVPRT